MSSILSVGKSALAAAQAGLATTGHNIANAATPGYSRQVVVQSSAGSQNMGGGFIGKGTEVSDVRRVFSELLANNVRSAQSNQNQIQTYHTQISRINNMLADTTAGLSPSLHSFFAGIQSLATGSNTAEARQTALSSAEGLAARFHALDGQLREVSEGINGQVESSVGLINTYAKQISSLNDAIEKAQGNSDGKASNDLLDQRDFAITELSKEIKTHVVKQGNSYNIYIGNGQPLVVGANTYTLTTTPSTNNASRMAVGYVSNGEVIELADSSISGGKLGGLLEFRSKSMDPAINALGRVAIGVAASVNEQHRLGMDRNGAPGGDFFVLPKPSWEANRRNTSDPPAKIDPFITDASALTADDYLLQFDGVDYTVTNLTTNVRTTGGFAEAAAAIKGVSMAEPDPAMAAGDSFTIRPTVNGATEFNVLIKDTAKIAAASPVSAEVPTTNRGSGKISDVKAESSILLQSSQLSLTYAAGVPSGTLSGFPADKAVSVTRSGVTTTHPPGTAVPYQAGDTVTVDGVSMTGIPATVGTHTIARPYANLEFNGGNLSGFPANLDVKVKHANGSADTVYTGVTPLTSVAYTAGDTISFGGVSFTMTGTPEDGATFTIGANPNPGGDNRNAVALGDLQNAKTMAGGSTTYQGAYAQMVSAVGNKTRELQVTNQAETRYLAQAETAMEAESGVNLDEEATNLMRYQQAYQAAARVMQTAGQLFEMLLTIGG